MCTVRSMVQAAWKALWPADPAAAALRWEGPVGTPALTTWEAIVERASTSVSGFVAATCDHVYYTADERRAAMRFTFTTAPPSVKPEPAALNIDVLNAFTFDSDYRIVELLVYANPR